MYDDIIRVIEEEKLDFDTTYGEMCVNIAVMSDAKTMTRMKFLIHDFIEETIFTICDQKKIKGYRLKVDIEARGAIRNIRCFIAAPGYDKPGSSAYNHKTASLSWCLSGAYLKSCIIREGREVVLTEEIDKFRAYLVLFIPHFKTVVKKYQIIKIRVVVEGFIKQCINEANV